MLSSLAMACDSIDNNAKTRIFSKGKMYSEKCEFNVQIIWKELTSMHDTYLKAASSVT